MENIITVTGIQHCVYFDIDNQDDKDSLAEMVIIAKNDYNVGIFFYDDDLLGIIGQKENILKYLSFCFGNDYQTLDQFNNDYPIEY